MCACGFMYSWLSLSVSVLDSVYCSEAEQMEAAVLIANDRWCEQAAIISTMLLCNLYFKYFLTNLPLSFTFDICLPK